MCVCCACLSELRECCFGREGWCWAGFGGRGKERLAKPKPQTPPDLWVENVPPALLHPLEPQQGLGNGPSQPHPGQLQRGKFSRRLCPAGASCEQGNVNTINPLPKHKHPA